MTEAETAELADCWTVLSEIAVDKYDGHFTILRFTTNWRIMFGTPYERECIDTLTYVGNTFVEAANNALMGEILKNQDERDDEERSKWRRKRK
jgi:hypothetical protein